MWTLNYPSSLDKLFKRAILSALRCCHCQCQPRHQCCVLLLFFLFLCVKKLCVYLVSGSARLQRLQDSKRERTNDLPKEEEMPLLWWHHYTHTAKTSQLLLLLLSLSKNKRNCFKGRRPVGIMHNLVANAELNFNSILSIYFVMCVLVVTTSTCLA